MGKVTFTATVEFENDAERMSEEIHPQEDAWLTDADCTYPLLPGASCQTMRAPTQHKAGAKCAPCLSYPRHRQ